MTTVHPDNKGGTQVLAQWMNPADWAECPRCGVLRKIHASRKGKLCRDCRTVEHHAARIEPEPAEGVPVYRRGVWVWLKSTREKAS